tara:strand:+ start:1671 stop:2405 length:735 start_codon:yes stop_codon:yes gene_type:complete
MRDLAIIIPSRLAAARLPNKPLMKIKDKEMILHVHQTAIRSDVGEVYVASADEQILNLIKKNGGNAIKTKINHETGTDRVYEAYEKFLKKNYEIIINLQGDMPNLNPDSIKSFASYIKNSNCDIGTLAGKFEDDVSFKNVNNVKVVTEQNISEGKFSKAVDFFRVNENNIIDNIYHHIGIYSFRRSALIKYVNLKRSKLEISRKLEQMRALENNMKIEVGFIKDVPLSIDTEEDLVKIKKLMNN